MLSSPCISNLIPADRLSVQPHWSPDGKAIVYSDYSGSTPPLIAVDLRTGRTTNLTHPGQYGYAPDGFISWRMDHSNALNQSRVGVDPGPAGSNFT